MKKLLRNLAVVALVLGVCSFDPIRGIPCDHQHDAECGYNEETGAGCTHTHDDGTVKPLDNHDGPLG